MAEPKELDPRNIAKLSPELIELILSAIADLHAEDPALQWTRGRLITGPQLRRIERHFYSHWLPDLCIILYIPPWSNTEFHFRPPSSTVSVSSPLPAMIRFKRSRIQTQVGGEPTSFEVKNAWDRYNRKNPNVHIMIGQRMLDDPPKRSPMVNDSELIDLCVSATGQEVTFNWRKTLNAFFSEEMYIRRRKEEMIGRPEVTNYAYCAFQHGRIRHLLWACM